MEIWKTIKAHPNYEVSNLGNVRHIKKKQNRMPQDNGTGYKFISIKENGKNINLYIHRIVAEAFVANPEGKEFVNHLDENKTNNAASNLEWTTRLENNNYGTRNEKISKAKSKPVYCVELDKVFEGAKAAAAELGANDKSICKCCRGIYKTAGNYHWRYAE